ncbi:hypothetical protein H0H93_015480 [Arthromyces matolae]|nr:hypothetical protein H0H93_015480 [Arthromyces matolae]
MYSRLQLIAILALFFCGSASTSSIAGGASDYSSQQPLSNNDNYTITSGNFGYLGVTGPLGWAGLSAHGENDLCSTGKHQSPINFDRSAPGITFPAPNPRVTIPTGYIDLENLGTTVEGPAVGTTQLNGRVYQLKQFHFHTPSEHLIFGEHYPLEVHFVHQAADGSKLVLGAVFDFTPNNGATTAFVNALGRQVLQVINPGTKTRVQNVNFSQFVTLFQTGNLFQYSGSLTTPPCSEGVTWLVAVKPLPIDTSTYINFKTVMKFNSRYQQNVLGGDNLIEVAANQFQKSH